MKIAYENYIVQLLSRLCDLILLQAAFLVTSLPILTVGAGITALFAVSRKMREDSVTSPIKEYFLQFRRNFKTSTMLWIAVGILAGVAYADAWYCSMGTSTLAVVGQILSYMLMIAVFLLFAYCFPQAAWFGNSVSRYLRNSLTLALAHPIVTILVVLLYVCAFIAAEVARPLFFLFGFSGVVYFTSRLFESVFFPDERMKNRKNR